MVSRQSGMVQSWRRRYMCQAIQHTTSKGTGGTVCAGASRPSPRAARENRGKRSFPMGDRPA
eukprot:5907727-Pyramimonas_sp.AAC.1